MKKVLISFMLIFCAVIKAQNTTTLTGTVTDSASQAWANATWTASIVIPGGGGTAKFTDGTSVPTQYSGQLNSSGTFPATTPVVGNTAKIVPTGVTWKYCFYSLTSAPPSCFNQATHGTTFAMGAYASSLITKPFIQAGAMVYAYSASEIHDSQNGNGYVNTISGTTFYWQGGQFGSYVQTTSGALTPSQIQTALQGQTGCNTDDLHWYSPFSGTCTPDTATNINNLLKTLTGCNIDGNHYYVPFLGQCVLVSSQVYPGAGAAISTGSAWGTSANVNGTLSGTTGFPVAPRTTTTQSMVYFCGTNGQQCGDGGFVYSAAAPGALAVYFTLQTPSTGGALDTVFESVAQTESMYANNMYYDGSNFQKISGTIPAGAFRIASVGNSHLGVSIDMLSGANPASCADTTCVGLVGIPGNQFIVNPGSRNPTFPTVSKWTINIPTTIDNLAESITSTTTPTHKVHVDQAAASQTANIYEVQDSTGAVLNGFDHAGNLINSPTSAWVQTDVTGSRTVNTIVTNGSHNITVSGSVFTSGSGVGNIACLTGATSPPTTVVWGNEATATVGSGSAGFVCDVPANYFYEVITSGAVGSSLQSWVETQK